MKTVAEVLKETGMTDEQIAALDPKVVTGVTTILSTAQSAQDAAENAKRLQAQQYDQEIAPALDAWGSEKATLTAQANYYKTLAEQAKAGGFLPGDAPFKPPVAETTRAADGKFVAGPTGSPEFVANFRKEAGAAIGSMLDLTWKYSALFGKPMPDSPTALIREAEVQRMDPITYAAKKYGFAERKASIKADEQKKHDDSIREEATKAADKVWAEKVGNNPNIRQADTSRFSTLNKAVSDKQRPDPLSMTREERHAATRNEIQKEIASNMESVH